MGANDQLDFTFPAHKALHVPLNSRLSPFVAENLLDMRDISTLCSLQKILLFPHLAWVREKGPPSFTNQLLFVYKVCHSHFVLRFWLVSYQSVIVQRGHARVPSFSLRSSSATEIEPPNCCLTYIKISKYEADVVFKMRSYYYYFNLRRKSSLLLGCSLSSVANYTKCKMTWYI